MASTSVEAASAPTSRPASPNISPEDPRNDQLAGDESAPLLDRESSPANRPRTTKTINFLTSSALSSSVFTLIFLIVTVILMSAIPYGSRVPYMTRDSMGALVVPALIAVLIGTVNSARIRKHRPLTPLALNILVDFIVAVLSIPWAANGLGSVSEPYDYDWGALPVRVVAGVAFGLALVFGIIHVVLFAVRIRVAFLMESWGSPWSFPNGQLTFEVSIKCFRDPQKPRQDGEDAV